MEEEIERGTWTGKLDFILSAIGYAVGVGNVWRFPYLTYKNGGASFLFPYIIMLLIAGLPLFFMELAIGQFTSEGPMTCWGMAPAFTGIGYAMVLISSVVGIYYNMIIAYSLYYMLVSFVNLDGNLPWENCDNDWNDKTDKKCRKEAMPRLSDYSSNTTRQFQILYDELYHEDCVRKVYDPTTYKDYSNGTSPLFTKFADGFMKQFNYTALPAFADVTATQIDQYTEFDSCEIAYVSPAEEYYKYGVLNEGDNESLNDIGDISLKLALTLLLAWILIFACLMKGIKTSGKVVYFTATFPYAVLIVLLIRGVTLDGAKDGIEFYLIPKWEKLTEAKIWGDAATQIFYSLGVGFGGLLTMASYNKFNQNCQRDAILVSFLNCGTSIFAGFAIFSMLGHMALVTNREVDKVATSGTGLAFVAYPDGISRLPGSPIWAFLFFFMLVTLGMDSQFAMLEAVISSFTDIFPHVLRKRKMGFTLILCIALYLLGLPLCTEGGGRVLTLMNWYSGSYNLMIIALSEIACTCYVYGISRFREDIEMMIGHKPGPYWIFMWCGITPLAVVFIIIVSAIQYEPATHNDKTVEPWAEAVGWLMDLVPVFLIILLLVIQVIRLGLKKAFSPQPGWGPALDEDRKGRYRTYVDENGDAKTDGGEKGMVLNEKVGSLNQGFYDPALANNYNY